MSRGTPGRPRTKVAIQCATKRKGKRKRNVEEYVTADEYARLKKDYLVAKKQHKDLLVGVLLEARMHNHVYDLLRKFDRVPGQYKFMIQISKTHNVDLYLQFWLEMIKGPTHHCCINCFDALYLDRLPVLIKLRDQFEWNIHNIKWRGWAKQAWSMSYGKPNLVHLWQVGGNKNVRVQLELVNLWKSVMETRPWHRRVLSILIKIHKGIIFDAVFSHNSLTINNLFFQQDS